MTLLPRLDGLERAMRELGRDLLAWRDDEGAREVHSPAELKTEADRRAHARLVEAIARDFPDVTVISEEDGSHEADRPERYWLIDPIDGTASWLGGFDGFVTQAALIEGEEAVAGLVFAPALDHFYKAAKGEGAWLDGVAMARMTPRDGLVITDNTPEPHGTAAALMGALEASNYCESGSLGLKCCLVADGTADLCAKTVLIRDWDLAPAAAIFAELGTVLANADGTPYRLAGAWEKPGGFIAARDADLARRTAAAVGAMA